MFGVGYVQMAKFTWPYLNMTLIKIKSSVRCFVCVQEGEQHLGGGRWRRSNVHAGADPPHDARVSSSGVRSATAALQTLQPETGSAAHLQTGEHSRTDHTVPINSLTAAFWTILRRDNRDGEALRSRKLQLSSCDVVNASVSFSKVWHDSEGFTLLMILSL